MARGRALRRSRREPRACPRGGVRRCCESLGLQAAAWDTESVRRVAKKFRLTPLATATRLRESGFMTWGQYNLWREQWEAYLATLPRRRGGFATPTEKAVNRAGRPFAQLLLEALSANRITSVDASRYLDLKFEHFDKLRAHLARGLGDTALDE